MTRRQMLRRLSALTAAGYGYPYWARGVPRATAASAGVLRPQGTTHEATIIPTGKPPYLRLTTGPAYPLIVRETLAPSQSGREDRRVALASLVHLTDIHVIDAQSPARVEFLDRYADPPFNQIPFSSAYRAQETLTTQVGEAMVQTVNRLGGGPVTGRPFDCAVSTGDNTDNRQRNELIWFLQLLDGGNLVPNSGGAAYEGVQDQHMASYDIHYYHPEDLRPAGDLYKDLHGFPPYPGLLAAAVAPFRATGLRIPWYSVYGNHDGLAQGNAPSNAAFDAVATSGTKVVGLPGATPADFVGGLPNPGDISPALLTTASARTVSPDPERRSFSTTEYIQLHLDSPGFPKGHGLTETAKLAGTLHYAFDLAPGVRGISLDTVNRGGYAEGSLGAAQLAWLETELRLVSARYFDSAGTEMKTSAADKLVVLFSHHALRSLTNPVPDPAAPNDQRIQGAAVEALLHRYPNVVLWVSGHSHENLITPRPDTSGRTGGFWEVQSSAHVDYPEQARLVEVVDNRDGTLSIFGTVVEHAAPTGTTVGATDVLGLAAISRELSVNDYQLDRVVALGKDTDRNVELLVRAPFNLSTLAAGGNNPQTTNVTGTAGSGSLPATGAGLPAGLAAAGLAAGLALRARTRTTSAPPTTRPTP